VAVEHDLRPSGRETQERDARRDLESI
jgi:hypothetical protein